MRLLPRLPIHSRCYLARRWAPPPPSPPSRATPACPSGGKASLREGIGALLHARPSERGLTYIQIASHFLHPKYCQSYNGRASSSRSNEIAFAYRADCPVPRVKDLARPWARAPLAGPFAGPLRERQQNPSLEKRPRYHAEAAATSRRLRLVASDKAKSTSTV